MDGVLSVRDSLIEIQEVVEKGIETLTEVIEKKEKLGHK